MLYKLELEYENELNTIKEMICCDITAWLVVSIIEKTVLFMSSVALGNERPNVIVGLVSFSFKCKIQSTLTLFTIDVESTSIPNDERDDLAR